MSQLSRAIKRVKQKAKQAARTLWGIKRYGFGRPVGAHHFEDQIYMAAVRAGDVVYDIGANVGDVSGYLARLVSRRGLVVAFEPVWSTYIELCQTSQQSDFLGAPIVTLPFGLSDTDGAAKITLPAGASGLASLRTISVWSELKNLRPVEEITCAFRRLDSLMEEGNLPEPQFMKIDVEGAELLVLKGARQLLSKVQPLMLMEVFAPWEASFDYTPWDVLSMLRDGGYRFFFACPEGLVEHEPTAEKPFPESYKNGYNVVAWVPEKHADRVSALRELSANSPGVLSMGMPPVPNVIAKCA